MSSVDYTDEFVREAIERLQDELPGVIDALNERHNDGLALAHPADSSYDDGTAGTPTNPPGTPWIEVTIGEDELGGGEGGWPLGQGQAVSQFPLVVLVHLEEPVPGPLLHRKLKRYAGAVTTVLCDPEAFATFAPSILSIRRVWRLNEQGAEELSSFAYLRFTYEMAVQVL